MSEVKGPKIWTRLSCDDDESWAAFVLYRDAKPPRRLIRPGAGTIAMLGQWYRANGWRERVAAYDAHLDEIRLEERDAYLAQHEKDIQAEYYGIFADARELIARELSKYLETSRQTETSGLIKPADLTRLMEATAKFERLTRGQTTENVEIGTDLSGLSVEELRTMEELFAKAAKKS